MNCLIDPRMLLQFDFGPSHPFKTYRLGLTYELMEAYGLVKEGAVRILKPRTATDEEVSCFHTDAYIEVLRLADSGMWVPNLFSHGLGTGDNPIFPGVYEWGTLVAGASIDCAKEILASRAEIAFNIAGGLHHAMPSHASGFCHINDVVLAIAPLVEAGKRVAYVDIDAHHGDGVQHAFYKTDQVLTLSVHQDGHTIFPGSGFVGEIGQGEGRGYALNVPLSPGARDDVFERVFDEILFPTLDSYAPDILVTQLGADALFGDRVANLGMSLSLFERYIERLRALHIPWLAFGGGGYAVENVARAWTVAWARMNDLTLPDEIPIEWQERAANYGISVRSLRGKDVDDSSSSPGRVLDEFNRTLCSLKEAVFPLIRNNRS
jgi:acetoin utilization protein AcuC